MSRLAYYTPEMEVCENEMMLASSEITSDASPSLSFSHGMAVYRVRVNNTGDEPIVIQSLEYPRPQSLSYGINVESSTGYYNGFGSSDSSLILGTVTLDTPITVSPKEIYSFFIPLTPCLVWDDVTKKTHILHLDNGKIICVDKNPTKWFDFAPGKLVTTTLSVRADMATGGEIPPISGSDEDDF